MISSQKKYVDPLPVLNTLVDDFGKQILSINLISIVQQGERCLLEIRKT